MQVQEFKKVSIKPTRAKLLKAAALQDTIRTMRLGATTLTTLSTRMQASRCR